MADVSCFRPLRGAPGVDSLKEQKKNRMAYSVDVHVLCGVIGTREQWPSHFGAPCAPAAPAVATHAPRLVPIAHAFSFTALALPVALGTSAVALMATFQPHLPRVSSRCGI